jgi:LacI family transcriptional regulator
LGEAQPKRRVTLVTVAQAAKVHVSSAAIVLNGANGNTRVSEETRRRVLEAADRLGYRPNRQAQNLRRRRSLTIGLVAGSVQNPFFAQMAALCERYLLASGYELLMAMDAGLYRDDRTLLDMMLKRGVDGIILWSERDTEGRRWVEQGVGCPVVIFGRPSERVDTATTDFAAGTRLGVEHLAALGRQKIAYLGPSEALTLWSGQHRRTSFLDAMAGKGYPAVAHCYEGELGSMNQAREAAERLGRSEDCPDGLVCFNDLVAVGALMGLRRAGRAVPEDVAVVGFDDIPMAAELDVPLTTLDMPLSEICRTAVEMLMDRLAGRTPDTARRVLLQPRLIVRASSLKVEDAEDAPGAKEETP